MSTLAEIENAVEVLQPAEQEALFQFLAARLKVEPVRASSYRTKVHPGSTLPGIDSDKLGQLSENL